MSRSVPRTQQKKIGYKGAAMYIHAYKLNFEYNLKNIKLLHFARQLIQDPAPYWNEGWLGYLCEIYGFQMYKNLNCFL